jgi:Peptidase M1 N-terminal domain
VSHMRRVFFFVALCFQTVFSLAAATDSTLVMPEHYSLVLTPEFEKNSFAGEETIRVRLSTATSVLQLNAAAITFDDVSVVSSSFKQIGKVVIDKEKELASISVNRSVGPGEISIEIRYRGVLQDSCCGFYTVKANNLTYGVILSSARYDRKREQQQMEWLKSKNLP